MILLEMLPLVSRARSILASGCQLFGRVNRGRPPPPKKERWDHGTSNKFSFPFVFLLGPVLLLVYSVTPFKIDQNKNQNRLIDKVQNRGNERSYMYKDPCQDSGQRNISYTRYPKKCFTQIYRDLYGDAMLVLTWMSSNMADGNQQKYLLPSFATKA